MIIINGPRASGKTAHIIKLASENDAFILCGNRSQVNLISRMAEDLGLKIKQPITPHELPLRGYKNEKVMIDNMESVVNHLVGSSVSHITTDSEIHHK